MKSWWIICLMFALVLAGGIPMIQTEVNAETCPIGGGLWTGLEVDAYGNPVGGYLGGEIYLSTILSPELTYNASFYDSFSQEVGLGLRSGFSDLNFGVGVVWANYEGYNQSVRGYGWASYWSQGLNWKVNFASTGCCEVNQNGKFGARISWATDQPIGGDASYSISLSPAGTTYQEVRVNASGYFGNWCPVCWESDDDCDSSIYIGLKAARFSDPVNVWFGNWTGPYIGFRVITPGASGFVEYQHLWREDCSLDSKIIVGASISFRGLGLMSGCCE